MSDTIFSSIVSTSRVTYTWMPDVQIHQMTFAESSHPAVDDWVSMMSQVYAALAPDDVLRLLIDMSASGMMPLIYSMGQGKRLADGLAFHPMSRVAMLHPSDRIRPFANAMMNTLRMGHLRTRFFDVDDHAGAVAWLREG